MTMQDPIADLLTRMRNAQMAGHVTVEIPNSKAKQPSYRCCLTKVTSRPFRYPMTLRAQLP